MPLQVLIFVLLFGLAQGFLVFLILLWRKNVKSFHCFLSAYIVVLLFQIAFKLTNKVWIMQHWWPGYELSYYLPYLYGPLVYFIASSCVNRFVFKREHVLHFLPFVMFLMFFVFYKKDTWLPGIFQYLFFPATTVVLQLGSIVYYHVIAKKLLDNYAKDGINKMVPLHISFAKNLVAISAVLTSVIAGTICLMYLAFPDFQILKWLFAGLTIFIYWMSLVLFRKPASFEVVFGSMGTDAGTGPGKSKLTILHVESKYINSGLKKEDADKIIKALHETMDIKQTFLDSTLTIDKLSAYLSCHRHHLSQVLNERLGVSFNEYINHKRVEASKLMLSDSGKEHFTIASIAYDAGFNSLSTFNDVFKKLTGVTPSHYRKFPEKVSRQQRI